MIDGSETTTYTYDAADRLASVTLPDATAIAYGYDADGRRIRQTVGSAVTNYLWDETSPYGDVVLETNGSGSTLASYVQGETGLLSQTQSGTTNYYLQDGQGSTRALTNSAGAVTDTYSYTAFGELFNQTGTTTNSYLYTGQQFDALTGLYDLRARYYNPALGRFLSQDTYAVNFNNPVELNRYVYVANDPINAIDPSGQFAEMVGTYQPARQNAPLLFRIGVGVLGVLAVIVAVGVLWEVVDVPRVLPKIKSLENIQMEQQFQEWLRVRPNPAPSPDPKQQPTTTPPPIILRTKTPRPGKVIVELGAGDCSNAIAKQLQYPGSTIFATNLKEDWEVGKQFFEAGLSPQQYPQIGIYLGWQTAQLSGW